MPRFRFEAVDAGGRVQRGVREAVSPRALRDELRAGALAPLLVQSVEGTGSGWVSRARLPADELALLTRQLATLVGSGTPVDQSLLALAQQAQRPEFERLLRALHEQVAAGEGLASALGRYPRAFSELYRGLVTAGLETGQLGPVLERLADYLDARRALRQRVLGALIYPALVTTIAALVVGALVFYVIPQVVAVYQQSRQSLPWLTRALIAFTGFARDTGVFWVAGAALAAAAATLALRAPRWREAAQRRLIGMPVIGALAVAIDSARFASTLAILTRSQAPLLRSIEAAAGVIRLLPLRRAATQAIDRVRAGVALHRALGEAQLFPPLVIQLVANGEASRCGRTSSAGSPGSPRCSSRL